MQPLPRSQEGRYLQRSRGGGGVHIGGGARKEDGRAGVGEGLPLGRRGGERDFDRGATGLLDGGKIGGEVAAVVVEVGTGLDWFGGFFLYR